MIDDIVIGQYALRTFKVAKRELMSPLKSGKHWRNGTCKAECLAGGAHQAPDEHCSCGVYGTLSLTALARQFSDDSTKLVTVIATEGKTIIGDTGLKTAYARVVAYWSPERRIRKVCKKQCVGATHFEDLDAMLTAYDLPRSEPLKPPGFHVQTLLGPLTAATASALGCQYLYVVGDPTYLSLHCNGTRIAGPEKIELLSANRGNLSWAAATFDVPAMSGDLTVSFSPRPDGPPVDQASCGFFTFTDAAQVVVTPSFIIT